MKVAFVKYNISCTYLVPILAVYNFSCCDIINLYSMVVEPTCDTGRVLQMVSSIVNGSEINRIHGKELDITMPHDGVANFAGKLCFLVPVL